MACGGRRELLKDYSIDFRHRVDRVFGCLPSGFQHECGDIKQRVPASSSPSSSPGNDHDYVRKIQYKGRRHGVHFKASRPRLSARYTPDYVKHPEKWTKYDLKEDGTEKLGGMSGDRVNKNAAFEFLEERRRLAKGKCTLSSDDSITYRKPEIPLRSVRGTKSVNVMPEYDFGRKKLYKKRTAASIPKQTPAHSVKLSHITEGEDSSLSD